MGSEDLFHKNRDRLTSGFKRKSATKNKPYKPNPPHILIVCEDSKSSAFYFEAMAEDLGLSAVKVRGKECGSAPSSILAFAEAQYAQSINGGDKYDAVYCVFDRDKHTCFDATVSKIQTLKTNKKPFYAITTTPCFEFWLLLHFKYTSASFVAKGKKSPCDCAAEQLKTADRLPDYGKNKRQTYKDTKDKLADAIAHAKRLVAENLQNKSSDPQTNMHELIEYLQSIKR